MMSTYYSSQYRPTTKLDNSDGNEERNEGMDLSRHEFSEVANVPVPQIVPNECRAWMISTRRSHRDNEVMWKYGG